MSSSNGPALVMLGDTLCTDYVPYQQVRKLLRAPSWIYAFLVKTEEMRIAFARELHVMGETT